MFVLFINLLQLLNITAETIQQDVNSKGMCTEETANGCEDSSKAESTTNNRNDDAGNIYKNILLIFLYLLIKV